MFGAAIILIIVVQQNQQYKDSGVVAKSLARKPPRQKVWR
jgi:hypothetical protein